MTDQIMGLGVVGTIALILIIAAIVNILRNGIVAAANQIFYA